MCSKNEDILMYFGRDDIFADLFNYLIYDGESIIQADHLDIVDGWYIYKMYERNVEIYNWLDKIDHSVTAEITKHDGKVIYDLLIVDDESLANNLMPVDCMRVETILYDAQYERIMQQFEDNSLKGASAFLSGMRIKPIVTLVLYLGAKKWSGDVSIHDMSEVVSKQVLEKALNYKMNLIVPAMMSDQDFNKFHTTLKEVLAFFKCSEDAHMMENLLETDETFNHLELTATRVLNSCLDIGLDLPKPKYEIDWEKFFEMNFK